MRNTQEALAELGDPSSGVQGARLFRDVFADDPQAPEDQQILPEDRWSVPGGSLAVGAHQQVMVRVTKAPATLSISIMMNLNPNLQICAEESVCWMDKV